MAERKSAPADVWLPTRLDLPYFAYGLLQPGELGYKQIESFVHSQRPAKVAGALSSRDGIPMMSLGSSGVVHGWLLAFAEPTSEAYTAIASFEPRKLYRWTEVVTDDGVQANSLVAGATTGSRPLEEERWSGKEDPVFTHAMSVIRDVADGPDGATPFASVPPQALDWSRFFRVQMAYLLLWSALERYLSLVYGPTLDPNNKLSKLGSDAAFARHLGTIGGHGRRVYESRSRESAVLDVANPKRAAEYFYVIRSNLSHRGKGAWGEAEMVREALRDLSAVFRRMLAESGIRAL
jgi:hypothetical protein